ncbi:hypothetical protein LRS06_16570 [Hymenobacter sp. J193]|uniref:hypothetical protein n=1 Tax=Hymenobacter sp. J193 TaxID=2898429 RepID=UPI00215148AA|nr:hypothetical protein [Hymenobacter sp. J193]MCR5889351.1 hypothetical protein [Hymenobacter sp. J193]
MSDTNITLVPRCAIYAEPKVQAAFILKWLVDLQVVEPEISDCVLGSVGGYARASGAASVVRIPERLSDLQVSGLELITNRQIFDSGSNGLEEIICPHCGTDSSNTDLSFLGSWAEGETETITCPHCETSHPIHSYAFSPAWGFSNLGFRFWNWPDFQVSFIEELESRLGCRIDVVHQRI